MAKTKRLGLNLTEDESTSFEAWRKSIDGNNGDGSKSNMQLIDDAMPLVVDEVLLLGASTTIKVGYTNSIDLASLNKTPRKDERFWGICKSSDGYVYSFVAKITDEDYTDGYASFEFVEVVLLHENVLSAFVTEGGYNLLDPNNAESGYYTNNSGVLTPTSSTNNLRTVTPITVEGVSTLYLASNLTESSDSTICILFLDESGAVIGQQSLRFSTILSDGVYLQSIPLNITKVHIWISGVSVGRSFSNLCVSDTPITKYEEYGAEKEPIALKEEYLPDISETVKQTAIVHNGVEKKPYFAGQKALEFPNKDKGLADDGSLYNKSSTDTTDYISIADTYQAYATMTNGVKYSLGYIAYYDENKNFIALSFIGTNYEFTEIDGRAYSYAFPLNEYPKASYVRIAFSNSSVIERTITPYITEYSMGNASIKMPTLEPLMALVESGDSDKILANNLKGKKIVFLGDSIFGNNQSSTGVVNQIATRVSGTVINGAFGGTRMSLRGGTTTGYDKFDFPSIVQAIVSGDYSAQEQAMEDYELPTVYSQSLQSLENTDFSTVDIIVFNHGTNDWTGGVNKETYQSALESNISTILQTYPHIQFIAVSPSWRCWITDNAITDDSDSKTYEMGTLPQVIDNMKEIAETVLHIPVIDCYNIGINRYNFANYFDGTDGTHQNAKGRALLARRIVSELF